MADALDLQRIQQNASSPKVRAHGRELGRTRVCVRRRNDARWRFDACIMLANYLRDLPYMRVRVTVGESFSSPIPAYMYFSPSRIPTRWMLA